MNDFVHNAVQLFYAIAGLTIALSGVPHVVMALITAAGLADDTVLGLALPTAGSQRQAIAAMTAVDIADQKRLSVQMQWCFSVMRSPRLHNLLRPVKGVLVDDAKRVDGFRLCFTVADDPCIDLIFDDAVDGRVREAAAVRAPDVHFVEIMTKTLSAEPFMDVLVKNELNDFSFIVVHNKIKHFFVPLVHAALLFKPIAIGD